MWKNLVLATALVGGLVAFGPLAATASAQPPTNGRASYVSPPYYPGYNPASVTPFGPGSYGGGIPSATPFLPGPYVPLAIPSIPLNNQDNPIYSGSFSNFGVPNGLSLYY